MRRVWLAGTVLVVGCASGLSASPPGVSPTPSASSRAIAPPPAPSASAPPSADAPVTRPSHPLTIPEARRYMLALVNRDRRTMGLAPVTLEEGPAQAAGQAHAEDMARLGYLGHWGSDGSVPEQRYTEAGGRDLVFENALCVTDGKARKLDPEPRIDPEAIERAEAMFFDEVPPNDGHRRNILRRWHNRLGIGIAQALPLAGEITTPCIAQEFVHAYGSYGDLPVRARVGSKLRVAGEVHAPATFAGVGLARIELPKPLMPGQANARRSYPLPQPYETYWPAGFKTPIPVQVDGGRFSVEVPLSDGGRAGLYEVSVWARFPGSQELVMVSLRTVRGEK